jgi:polyphosphate kinase
VERFFVEAADDAAVAAIKLTLYRAGGRSGIVDALLRAARAGKEVFVFVELKARFDEERNVDWARKLEEAGIHVVYGLVKLKTHCKTALVVRRENGAVRRYVHIGTGNYNAATAALYTDLGLLSADEGLGADLNDLFNELSGSSRPPETQYRRLLVAPTHMLPRFLQLIDREAEHARAGRGGRIRVKLNGLADGEVILALYRAAQAGVDIAISDRGTCCLRPGVPGLSERIRVVSVLGRFLEHARIFHFANGGQAEYYIGSADWRPRNLRRRVEVVTPVLHPEGQRRLDRILTEELDDPTAWALRPDGRYERRQPDAGRDGRSAQQRLVEDVESGMRRGP